MDDFAIPDRVGDTVLRRIGRDDEENAKLVALYADAYTVLDLGEPDKRERHEARLRATADEPGAVRIAAYRDGRLVGAMRWYDFTMKLRSRDVLAGGIGSVAVALDARRRGVGRDMVRAFVGSYRTRNATIALLHPFRHDFYRALGFGHGTKMNRYRVEPLHLPDTGEAVRVRQVGASSAEALAACYERVRLRTNGLIATSADELRRDLENLALRAFACFVTDDLICGYVFARPFLGKAQNANANELRVYEPIVEDPAALVALLTFLRSLSDQFAYIVLETQDDAFHIVPNDPRDASRRILHPPAFHETNTQGAGVMYRVLDVPRALEALEVDPAPPRRRVWASMRVSDALIPENSEAFDLALDDDGTSTGVSVALDIAEFSSLAVGSLRFRSIYDNGFASVSPPTAVARLDKVFAADRPPFCTTSF